MSARHRLPRSPGPDGDGMFAGIVLVAVNLFGLGLIVAGQAPQPAHAAVALDDPPAEDLPAAGPLSAKKDSGPAAPPAPPRPAQPVCHDAGCSTVPSRPESSDLGGTGRHHQTPPGSSVNLRGSATPYESGSGSSNRPRNAITDV